RKSVIVSVEPIAWLVERIAGEHFAVRVLVPAGREPETYAPTPSSVASLIGSRIFFKTGLPLEDSFLPKLRSMTPDLKAIDLSWAEEPGNGERYSFDDPEGGSVAINGSNETGPVSRAGAGGTASVAINGSNETVSAGMSAAEVNVPAELENPESGTAITNAGEFAGDNGNYREYHHEHDLHFWMSPRRVLNAIPLIVAGLSETDPEHAADFQRNADQLTGELISFQKEIEEQLSVFAGRTIVVAHPAYGCFCEEFHLTQLAIEKDGKSPKPQDLARLITQIREEQIRCIIVQPEFNQSDAEAITSSLSNVRIVTHSPLERDYFRNLRELTVLITLSFQP
ncbi:MAG: zinc ABC transporter substrate-binding protein, partial [Thermoguttaceae bacterium]|nr:zinc ABC transporter substrate-binding protein [Thermoguttaceae bacterium]